MEWRSVVFAHERSFNLGASDDRVSVGRMLGERLQPNSMWHRHTGRTPGVMHHPQPALTAPVLTQQVQQAWNSVPQSEIRHLFDLSEASPVPPPLSTNGEMLSNPSRMRLPISKTRGERKVEDEEKRLDTINRGGI
ncbi:hypothetical protein TNCV_4952501 [Trichonephila clavipes]|nr:hypothetical protein TNCV_4952501 [Trichonephila clavipes]